MSTKPGPWAKCFPHSLSFNSLENPRKRVESIITPVLQARKPRPGKWKHLPKCTRQEAADPDSRASGCSDPHPVSPPTLLESRSPVDPHSSLWESPDLPLSFHFLKQEFYCAFRNKRAAVIEWRFLLACRPWASHPPLGKSVFSIKQG